MCSSDLKGMFADVARLTMEILVREQEAAATALRADEAELSPNLGDGLMGQAAALG